MKPRILIVLSMILLLVEAFFVVSAGSHEAPNGSGNFYAGENVMNVEPPEGVSVYPTNYIFSVNTTLHSKFNVTIWVGNVSNLGGYHVHLSYNTTLLNATQAWIPTWQPEFPFYGQSPVATGMRRRSSDVVFCAGLGTDWNFNGSGLLGLIEFEVAYVPVVGSVESILNLTVARLFHSNPVLVSVPPYLGDANGDLEVDNWDANLLRNAFPWFEGEIGYNSAADFDGDGAVLIYDYLCVLWNLGRDYNFETEAFAPQEITVVKTNGNYKLSALTGDLNGDWTVNILDTIPLANAFGSTPLYLNWNPSADLNNDEVVDIIDAIILMGHFGETWM